MSIHDQVQGMPGVSTGRQATHYTVLRGGEPTFLPAGVRVAGARSRDHSHTSYLDYLRPGLMLGLLKGGTHEGKFAPALAGLVTLAYAGSTALRVATTAATEINRRVGTSGTLWVVDDAGTLREVTFSGVDTTTGDLTITALDTPATDQVTVIDFGGTPDGGTFRVGINGEWTAEQAYNVSTADLQTALEGLASLTSGDVTVTGSAGDTYTLTFGGDLAGQAVTVELDSEVTDGGAEVEVTQSNTTEGAAAVDVDVSVGAPVLYDDEAASGNTAMRPRVIVPDGYPVRVTNSQDESVDVPLARPLIGGVLDTDKLRDYPATAQGKLWIKGELGKGLFVFDDDFEV